MQILFFFPYPILGQIWPEPASLLSAPAQRGLVGLLPLSRRRLSRALTRRASPLPALFPVPALGVGHEVRRPKAQAEEGLKPRYTNL